MTIIASNSGQVRGKFTIPANIPAGTKTVEFTGSASTAFANFTGQGNHITNIFQDITSVTTIHWWVNTDPLAQTFTLNANTQISGIDLWFTAKGGDVRVQIRKTQTGFPTREVIADVTVPMSNIVVSGGGHTRVAFANPVSLLAGEEYAFVILCDDATTALAVAELGKFDSLNQVWVTAQPYTVGTLLSSSNASTWTAHQDKDLAFRLLEADFTITTSTVNLGQTAVEEVTDLLLLSIAETPSASSRIEYELELPSGNTLNIANGQAVRLDSPQSGMVTVKAKLYGEKSSPVLYPNTQVLSGKLEQEAEYYTRSITATNATKAILIYDAIIPSGASVTAFLQKDKETYQEMISNGTTEQGDGLVEFRFKAELNNIDLIKAKLILSGNSNARPVVRNIRFMAVI